MRRVWGWARARWRAEQRAVVAAGLAAVVPVVVAGVRAALRGWTPTGDDAASAIRAHDVFTGNVPLLGTWSSASAYTGHLISHPGPLHFDLLAIPVRLLGPGPGTAVGTALGNAAAVAALGWLVHRRLGPAAATVAYGLAACLTWSLGSEMLFDPWSQYAPLLPFALFVVAVWCTVAGDVVAAPVAVVAGSLALQTHLSYVLLVPGLAAFGAVAVLGRLAVLRREAPAAWPARWRRAGRWGAVTLAVALLCWAQPLAEEVTAEGESNLTALVRSASAEAPTPGPGRTIRALGGTLVVPPAWLPPSYGSPSFGLDGRGVPTWLAALGLVGLAAACGVLGARAWRRGSTAVAAGAAVALVGLVLAVATCLRAPIRFAMAPTYFRWMWPFGMVLWLVLAVAVLDELGAGRRRGWRPGWLPPWRGRPWAPGLALAVGAGLLTLPTVDNGNASPPWAVEGAHAVDDPVVAAVRGRGPVLVDVEFSVASVAIGPAVQTALVDAGIPFLVRGAVPVRQLGEGRAYAPGAATQRLRIAGGFGGFPRPGERLVATFHALSDAEQAELDRRTAEVVALVEEHGLPLSDDAERVFDELGQPWRARQLRDAAADPVGAVHHGLVVALWQGGEAGYARGPLLDTTEFPRPLMDRWAELQALRYDSWLVVYRSDLPPS